MFSVKILPRAGILVLGLLLLISFLCAPALAGTRYFSGTPNLTAAVPGTDQYPPGADIQIPVVIRNTGISTDFEVSPSIVDRPDVPMTAKFVTVAMDAGDAPIVIKSDPQMIGDIASQAEATAAFSAKVNADAAGGMYWVPLNVTYTHFVDVNQYLQDTFQSYYETDNVTLYVPITIKSEAIPAIVSARGENLVAGQAGYVNLTIQNAGSLDGTNATVQLRQDGTSAITPLDNSVYIGDFPAGGTVYTEYKVNVSTDAESKIYPVDLVVMYQDSTGSFVTSSPQTTGVAVGNKVNFAVVSAPVNLYPGSRNIVDVSYQNTGAAPVEDAYARITVADPFTSAADLVYLGDVAPGQTVVAPYQVSVASDATLKEYGLDTQIRYTDSLDDTYVSDPLTVAINVKNPTGVQAIISSPLNISIIVIMLVIALIVIRQFRKKKH